MPITEILTASKKVHTLTPGVALQFALDSFLETYRDMLTMQRLITRHFGFPLAAFAFSKKSPAILKQLFEQVESLVGMPAYPFPHILEMSPSRLYQLRLDCGKLAALKGPAGVESALLEALSEKAWLEGHHALYAFKHGSIVSSADGPTLVKRLPFLGHIITMIKLTDRFANTLPKLLRKFRTDENVLLFLLRRRSDFDVLRGIGFVRGLLIKLHPKGRDSLKTFLTAAYTKRGFTSLAPLIDTQIEELLPW